MKAVGTPRRWSRMVDSRVPGLPPDPHGDTGTPAAASRAWWRHVRHPPGQAPQAVRRIGDTRRERVRDLHHQVAARKNSSRVPQAGVAAVESQFQPQSAGEQCHRALGIAAADHHVVEPGGGRRACARAGFRQQQVQATRRSQAAVAWSVPTNQASAAPAGGQATPFQQPDSTRLRSATAKPIAPSTARAVDRLDGMCRRQGTRPRPRRHEHEGRIGQRKARPVQALRPCRARAQDWANSVS